MNEFMDQKWINSLKGYEGPKNPKPMQPNQSINPRPERSKSLITIKLNGCDDTTIFTMDVDEKELLLLQRVSKLSEETSAYNCMPTMKIEEK